MARWWRSIICALIVFFAVLCAIQTRPGAHGLSIASAIADESGQVTAIPTPNHLIVGPAINLPAGLFTANPMGSHDFLTSSQANIVAAAMWQLWETALIERDTTALSQLVAQGPLLAGELYNCAWPTGGCVQESSPRPIYSLQTVVPVLSSYPLYFLAEIRTSQYVNNEGGPVSLVPWVELQILTKAGPAAPWQMNFDSGYDGINGGTPPLLPLDFKALPSSEEPARVTGVDMYNPSPSRATGMGSSQLLAELANYWQAWKDHRAAPPGSNFVNDGDTSGFGASLAKNPQNNVYRGSRQHYMFASDPAAGLWTFSASAGFPMVCGTVLDNSTNTPTSSTVLVQNSSRTNWGMPLAPGYYKHIATQTTHQACVYTVPGGLDAAGNSGFDISVTGPRASPLRTFLIIRYPYSLVLGAVIVVLVAVVVLVLRRRNRGKPPGPVWTPPRAWPPPPPPSWPPPTSAPWPPNHNPGAQQ